MNVQQNHRSSSDPTRGMDNDEAGTLRAPSRFARNLNGVPDVSTTVGVEAEPPRNFETGCCSAPSSPSSSGGSLPLLSEEAWLLVSDLSLVTDDTPLSVEQQVAWVNMKRRRAIQDLRTKIRQHPCPLSDWGRQLDALETELFQATLHTRLSENPDKWRELPPHLQADKKVLLTVMNTAPTSTRAPPAAPPFTESDWQAAVDGKATTALPPLPPDIFNDRDIFLARVRHSTFAPHFTRILFSRGRHYPCAALEGDRLPVPGHFLADAECRVELIRAYSPILAWLRRCPSLEGPLAQRDVLDAVLQSRHLEGCCPQGRAKLMKLLSRPLRLDPEAMEVALLHLTLLAAEEAHDQGQIPPTRDLNRNSNDPESFVHPSLLQSKDFVLRVTRAVWEASIREPAPRQGQDARVVRGGMSDDEDDSDDGAAAATNATAPWPQLVRRSFPLWLSDLAPELQVDPDVVLAFCKILPASMKTYFCVKSGSGKRSSGEECCSVVQALSQVDEEIIQAACEEDPLTILSSPLQSKSRARLLSNKDFCLDAILQLSHRYPQADSMVSQLFDSMSPLMQQHREVAAVAAGHSTRVLNRIKMLWDCDSEFWCHLLQAEGKNQWKVVPSDLRSDPVLALAFGRHASRFAAADLEYVLKGFPQLLTDHQVIRNMVTVLPSPSLAQFVNLADKLMALEKKLCLELIEVDKEVYDYFPPHLKWHRELVEAVFLGGSSGSLVHPIDSLELVPPEVMLQYPDIVARALRNWGRADRRLYEALCPQLWTNREVAMAWLCIDGWWHSFFPVDFRNDEEMLLGMARGHPSDSAAVTFSKICPTDFMHNAEFLLKAIRSHKDVWFRTPPAVKSKLDLRVVAYAKNRNVLKSLDHQNLNTTSDLMKFAKYVRGRLASSESFWCFLMGTRSYGSTGPLRLLNQGSEASNAYLKRVAAFADIPVGIEYQELRRVSVDLTRWGY